MHFLDLFLIIFDKILMRLYNLSFFLNNVLNFLILFLKQLNIGQFIILMHLKRIILPKYNFSAYNKLLQFRYKY